MTAATITHVRPANVDALLHDLAAKWRADPGERLELDWSHVSRLEGAAGPVLAAALLGTLGEPALRVKVEPRPGNRHWLMTSGMAFALANRRGEVTVDGLAAGSLEEWRRTWTPGTEATWHKLFGEPQPTTLFNPEDVGESPLAPDRFGPYYAAFTNPHRQGASTGYDTAVTRVLWPWLDRLIPEGKLRPRRSQIRLTYIGQVGIVIDELLSNVAEHGTALGFGPSIHSLVQVFVTRGGKGSFDRLHLSIWDTGAGIPQTARPKLGAEADDISNAELVQLLFSGRIPGWSRGRGMGLPKVLNVARGIAGASLFVATGDLRLCTRGRRAELRSTSVGFPIQGTVVAAVLPLTL